MKPIKRDNAKENVLKDLERAQLALHKDINSGIFLDSVLTAREECLAKAEESLEAGQLEEATEYIKGYWAI